MSKFIDHTGERFGRLEVRRRVEKGDGKGWFLVRCDCGVEFEITGGSLRGNKRYKGARSCERCKMHPAIEFNGKTLSLPEWAEELGLPLNVIHTRMSRGWSIADTLQTPLNQRRKRHE